MAKDVKNQNKPMYKVHCTECGEVIENKFFPLNQLLKQYYHGPQYQHKIADVVDFLGIGALYGQAVLPDVPAFVDRDGNWNFNMPSSFDQSAPPEFTCSDNEIPKNLLVDVNLNIASMVAQFCMITGFEDIYPMLKLRQAMDALLANFQNPTAEQDAQWGNYCNQISWLPGVKIDPLLTPAVRNAQIAVLLSDILKFAELEANVPGRRHFAAQGLKIGWQYIEKNQRKMPFSLVARGASGNIFDAKECCCDKCRRPLLWDMGAYPQKVIGILGTQGVGKTTYLMALADLIPEIQFKKMTITHDSSDPQRISLGMMKTGNLWRYQNGYPPIKTPVEKAPALTFRIQKNKNSEPVMYTLADIPGEAFDKEYIQQNGIPEKVIQEITALLKASDDLILVVNSDQLRKADNQKEVSEQANKSDLQTDPAVILTSIKEYLKKPVSTAVVLTAADMLGNLRSLLGLGYDIRKIQPLVYSAGAKKYVYNAEMMSTASRTVDEYIDKYFGNFMHNLTESYVPEGSAVSAFLVSSGTQYALEPVKDENGNWTEPPYVPEEAKVRYAQMRNARFGVAAPLMWLLTCEGLLAQGRADAFFNGYDEKVRRRILQEIN